MKRLLVLALAAAACGRNEGPAPVSPVKNVTIVLATTQIVVGGTTQATARLTDANGAEILDRSASWSSVTPSVVSVSPVGLVTGLQPGTGTIRAIAGAVQADAQILVTNPLAASVALSRDTATVQLPGGAVQLIALVKDAAGNVITNPAIFWQSLSPLIATVNAQGLVTATAVGVATVRATVDGQTAQTVVTVKITPNASAPLVVAVNPSTLRPGGTFTVVGNNFGASAAANAVVVDGVSVTVTAATTTAMSITLPTTGFACDPTRTVFVQVTAGGLVGGGPAPLRVANLRTLGAGQSVVISSLAEVRCNELPLVNGGRYLISVYNAVRSPVTSGATGSATVNVRGAVGASLIAGSIVPLPGDGTVQRDATARSLRSLARPTGAVVSLAGGAALGATLSRRRTRELDDTHVAILERNLAYARSKTFALGSARSRSLSAPGPNTQITTLGAVTAIKLPNLDAGNFCANSVPVGARTVFVGPHTIIVEDTATTFSGKPTLQGQMNATFAQLGQEFEDVMWPILTSRFGNPLALDAQLSNTGKIVMVFSPKVNGLQGGRVLGFVVTCDFQSVAQAPSSNVGEYFYATVPTSATSGFLDPESRESWLRNMRATVVHEVKHITQFGERLSRSAPFEDASWEEGMARNVEEMYARTIYGVQQGQNVSYAASVGCDLHFAGPTPLACIGRPLLMLRHFDGLYSFLLTPESLSPLGRVFGSDLTFYASAWSFERWAADHYGTSEAQFFKDLTTAATTGVSNLEQRTGHPWEEMLGEWSLALALDDRAGFTPENARFRMPSWNLRDMFQGMCNDLGPCAGSSALPQLYLRAAPLMPHALTFGTFAVNSAPIVGGGFSVFELGGVQPGNQVLELRSLSGADPASTIRLAIVRIQ